MKIEITECDICGRKQASNKEHHWSDCIEKIVISFKNHPGVQSIPFEGECCTSCAKALEETILATAKRLSKEKGIKHED